MTNTIELFRENDRTIELRVHKPTSTINIPVYYNLTGCTVKMYIKRKITDYDENALLTITGVITDYVNGLVEFTIDPEDTESTELFKDGVNYTADFEVETASPNSKKYTVLRTTFTLKTK